MVETIGLNLFLLFSQIKQVDFSYIFLLKLTSLFRLFNERRQRVKTFRLSDVYFKPDLIVGNGMFSSFVRGLTFQAAQKINSGYTKEVRLPFVNS